MDNKEQEFFSNFNIDGLKVVPDENKAKDVITTERAHEIQSKKRLIKGKVVTFEDVKRVNLKAYEWVKRQTNDFNNPTSMFLYGGTGKTTISLALQNFFIDSYKGRDDQIISVSERWLIHNVLSNNRNAETFFNKLETVSIIFIGDCFEPDNFSLFWENSRPAIYQRQMYKEFIDRLYRLETKVHIVMESENHFAEVIKDKDNWLRKRLDMLFAGKSLKMTDGKEQ